MEKKLELIKKFQCCGCTCGSDPETCKNFKLYELPSENILWCSGHSAGTILMGVGKIALGLPKGFNRVGNIANCLDYDKRTTNIRIHPQEEKSSMGYNNLNVPVWAMEYEGDLFVRCFCPRINFTYVDIYEGGKLSEICPNAINVGEFIDEID